MSNRPVDCAECSIPDVNCYEQCLGCFGASFDDCDICPKHGVKKEESGGENDE